VANHRSYGYGLGLLPPPLRLVLAVTLTSAFIYIDSVRSAIVALICGLLLVILNLRFKLFRIFLFVVLSEAVWRVAGNWIFSPSAATETSHFLLRFNQYGFENGLIGGLKRVAMICVGYATLMSSRYYDYYEAVVFFFRPPLCKKWVMWFFRLLQIKALQMRGFYWSVLMRGIRPRKSNPRQLIQAMKVMLQSLGWHIISEVGKFTFAGETKERAASDGSKKTLDLEDVSVSYDALVALSHINLSVSGGEFIVLLGKNGAGKSTLLRLLSGYIPWITGAYTGNVTLDGVSIAQFDLNTIARSIKYIPDSAGESIAGLTVEQEVMLLARDKDCAIHAAEAMCIQDIWQQESDTLSGGQKSRCALAGILASGVKFVLLDNPLEPLDQTGREEFVEALLDFLRNSDSSVIVTDHFYYELMPYATRTIILDGGRIIKDAPGPPVLKDVYDIAGIRTEGAWPRISCPPRGELLAELSNIHLSIDGREVLRGFALQVYRGEQIALTGPNGSGKTTAMLVLAGLLKPRKGKVVVNSSLPYPVRMMMQDYGVHFAKATVREQLQLQPQLDKCAAQRTKQIVEETLSRLRLSGDENTFTVHPATARMVAAVDVASGGELIVFDEPSVGFDAREVEDLLAIYAQLVSSGKAVISITHDPRLIRAASRVLVLNDGSITRESVGAISVLDKSVMNLRTGAHDVWVFEYGPRNRIAFALCCGDFRTAKRLLVRVQFGCVFGTSLQSLDCDCGLQMDKALMEITAHGPGLLVYLPGEEGRGHGLGAKIRMMSVERTLNTSPFIATVFKGMNYANYSALTYVPYILDAVGVSGSVHLMTNNPQKVSALGAAGVAVCEVVPLTISESDLSEIGRMELLEKRELLGHV
jgi:energy-coupling factor transport system ATP-binding protein